MCLIFWASTAISPILTTSFLPIHHPIQVYKSRFSIHPQLKQPRRFHKGRPNGKTRCTSAGQQQACGAAPAGRHVCPAHIHLSAQWLHQTPPCSPMQHNSSIGAYRRKQIRFAPVALPHAAPCSTYVRVGVIKHATVTERCRACQAPSTNKGGDGRGRCMKGRTGLKPHSGGLTAHPELSLQRWRKLSLCYFWEFCSGYFHCTTPMVKGRAHPL